MVLADSRKVVVVFGLSAIFSGRPVVGTDADVPGEPSTLPPAVVEAVIGMAVWAPK